MSRKLRLLLGAVAGRRHLRLPLPARRTPAADAIRAAAAAGKVAAPATTRRLGRLAFKPCTLAPQFGAASGRGAMRQLSVAENPALPHGPPDRACTSPGCRPTTKATPSPIRCSCSPAAPARRRPKAIRRSPPAFAEVRKKRDVILVDQRGTGESNPLMCKDAEGESAASRRRGRRQAAAPAPSPQRCRARVVEERRPALLHHHRRDPRPRRGAPGDRRARRSTWSASPTAPASPSSTRCAIRTHAHDRARSASRRTRWCSATNSRATWSSALDLQFGAVRQDAGLRQDARQSARAPGRADGELRTEPPLVRYRDASTGEMQARSGCRPSTSPA